MVGIVLIRSDETAGTVGYGKCNGSLSGCDGDDGERPRHVTNVGIRRR